MKRAIALILALSILASSTGSLAAEPDAKQHSTAVRFCIDNAIIYPDEVEGFNPEALISKMMFITQISRILGLYDDTDIPFYAAKEQHFAAAVAAGIICGEDYPPESWARPLGRFEAAEILYRVLTGPGGYQDDGDEIYTDNMPDKNGIPARYLRPVNVACQLGLMGSTGANRSFSGWNGLTGAEACTVLHRLLDESVRPAPTLPAEYGKLLSRFTTSYEDPPEEPQSEYRKNSIFNMLKAGACFNGIVLEPGQVFSFNRTIGSAEQAGGYRQGIIVSGGKKVPGYGGGICQTSTTLFNAALHANLEILERHNHGLKSTYVPAGADSSIYYPSVDLRIQNTYPNAIKFVFDNDAGAKTLTVKIYGMVDTYTPTVALSITVDNGLYTLTRSADGIENYTCTSRYRD